MPVSCGTESVARDVKIEVNKIIKKKAFFDLLIQANKENTEEETNEQTKKPRTKITIPKAPGWLTGIDLLWNCEFRDCMGLNPGLPLLGWAPIPGKARAGDPGAEGLREGMLCGNPPPPGGPGAPPPTGPTAEDTGWGCPIPPPMLIWSTWVTRCKVWVCTRVSNGIDVGFNSFQ